MNEVVGNVYNVQGALECLQNARNKVEINQYFSDLFASGECENTATLQKSKTALFLTFDEQISHSATLTPEYVETKRREMDDDLWYATTALLDKQSGI